MSGPLALVGSGEFLSAMTDTDAALIEGRSPVVGVLPAAAAPEGDDVVRRWFDLAHRHYAGLGAQVEEIDVRTRDEADDPSWPDRLHGLGLIYLSGGNPTFLADLLRGTALGDAIGHAWRSGCALAGCSAGAMALGLRTLAVAGGSVAGLGLAGDLVVVPHYDRSGFPARMAAGAVAAVDAAGGGIPVGIDEDTALVWWPAAAGWAVSGRSRAWVGIGPDGSGTGYVPGDTVPLPPPAG